MQISPSEWLVLIASSTADHSKMYVAYILYSPRLGKFCVGHTQDLDARLEYHNAGHVKWTSLGVPWKLVHNESFPTKAEAARRELQIKKWKSAKAIRQLIERA